MQRLVEAVEAAEVFEAEQQRIAHLESLRGAMVQQGRDMTSQVQRVEEEVRRRGDAADSQVTRLAGRVDKLKEAQKAAAADARDALAAESTARERALNEKFDELRKEMRDAARLSTGGGAAAGS